MGSTPSRTISFDLAYAPFGEQYSSSGSTDPAFTSQRQDTVAGLYDFPEREYNIQGRWPNPDPSGLASATLADPQTLNRYAYVRNNPLALVDPLGLECSPVGGDEDPIILACEETGAGGGGGWGGDGLGGGGSIYDPFADPFWGSGSSPSCDPFFDPTCGVPIDWSGNLGCDPTFDSSCGTFEQFDNSYLTTADACTACDRVFAIATAICSLYTLASPPAAAICEAAAIAAYTNCLIRNKCF